MGLPLQCSASLQQLDRQTERRLLMMMQETGLLQVVQTPQVNSPSREQLCMLCQRLASQLLPENPLQRLIQQLKKLLSLLFWQC